MAVQKFVTYNVLDKSGQILDNQQELKLTVLETFGNYLIHKDISRQQIQQKHQANFDHYFSKYKILQGGRF